MDPAFYTLMGALGGILITQIANYFLEDKKSKNLIALKSIEIKHQGHSELLKERRIAYAQYLNSLDQHYGKKTEGLADIVGDYYSAIIVSRDVTTELIREVFELFKDKDFDVDTYLASKRKLIDSMKADLQDEI